MAKARPEKRREKSVGAQPSLPGTRASATPSATRVLPMQLKIGDRIADEAGEWEVANRPHTTAGGKVAHVRVRRADQPAVVEERTWGAHERVEVKRA
jgi:hypothetical protein